MLNCKKPGFWISISTILAIIISTVCFFAVPPVPDEEPDPLPTAPNTPTAPPASNLTQSNIPIGDLGSSKKDQALIRYYQALDQLLSGIFHLRESRYDLEAGARESPRKDIRPHSDIFMSGENYLFQRYTNTLDRTSGPVLTAAERIRNGIEYTTNAYIPGAGVQDAAGWFQASIVNYSKSFSFANLGDLNMDDFYDVIISCEAIVTDAIEEAQKEYQGIYTHITAEFDYMEGVWRINFHEAFRKGPAECICLASNGTTLRITQPASDY